MRMYHIHKKEYDSELWQVGNTFTINDENHFWKFSKEYRPPIYKDKNDKTLFEMAEISKEVLSIMENAISEYGILIREITLENVRKEFFPNLPSRQKCIWLAREDQIEYWKKNINKSNIDIYEVEVDENLLFKSRDSLLPKLNEKYTDIIEHANNYWNYSSDTNNEDDEYLYCGDVQIIRKVEL